MPSQERVSLLSEGRVLMHIVLVLTQGGETNRSVLGSKQKQQEQIKGYCTVKNKRGNKSVCPAFSTQVTPTSVAVASLDLVVHTSIREYTRWYKTEHR